MKKNSDLFVALLEKLNRTHSHSRRIHVILDNYVIHRSRRTREALAALKGRIVLHFLPPYCPDDNRIERKLWRETHATATRNYNCRTMKRLMAELAAYFAAHNATTAKQARKAA